MRLTPVGKRDRRLLLELTPMVDIVFLLIIFFMVTSEFARDARADVELPRLAGEQLEQSEEAGLFINIDEAGNIVLSTSEDPISMDELAKRVRLHVAGEETPRVTVRADRQGPMKVFNEVIRVLDEAGVSSARIATEVPR
ncbi:MAG: biopolymer transporter ExbD [Phycisphaerales bacterium]|nr:biopolymer transporter ExbD [Phycisphaerales bacterium]